MGLEVGALVKCAVTCQARVSRLVGTSPASHLLSPSPDLLTLPQMPRLLAFFKHSKHVPAPGLLHLLSPLGMEPLPRVCCVSPPL